MIAERAFAKINLYLEVTGKRPDGYHDLVTVMQTVSLADTLTFRESSAAGVHLITDCGLPTDGKNLIVRAADAYFRAFGRRFGAEIILHKEIPAAAGLGGGSADAAATLRGLNQMAGVPFSAEKLREIAFSVGADVPFLVEGGTALCRGVGERISRMENHLPGTVVIAIRGEGVSTPAAFGELDRIFHDYQDDVPRRDPAGLLAAMQKGDADAATPFFFNGFEEVILRLRPAVSELKNMLKDAGATVALMSGSGPSVFGWFYAKEKAVAAQEMLLAAGARAFICHPVEGKV